jgi:hypothetical protein
MTTWIFGQVPIEELGRVDKDLMLKSYQIKINS